MTFEQLSNIYEIYLEGSISKAAEKLFISQPAMSNQLLKVEKEIGIKIFDRSTIPLRPTYAGKKYLDYIHQVLVDEKQIRRILEDISSLKTGELTIGIPQNRTSQLLPVLLPHFIEQYPGITLQIKEFRSATLESMILDDEIDLACMVPQPSSPQIEFLPIINEEVLIVMAKDYPANKLLEGLDTANPALLKDYPFILLKPSYRIRSFAEAAFREANIRPQVVLETSNMDLALDLTAANLGITFTTTLSSKSPHGYPNLRFYKLPNDLNYEFGIQYHKNKYISEIMEIFIKKVKEILENGYLYTYFSK